MDKLVSLALAGLTLAVGGSAPPREATAAFSALIAARYPASGASGRPEQPARRPPGSPGQPPE